MANPQNTSQELIITLLFRFVMMTRGGAHSFLLGASRLSNDVRPLVALGGFLLRHKSKQWH